MHKFIFSLLVFFLVRSSMAQTFDVAIMQDEQLRREQLMGRGNARKSFAIRSMALQGDTVLQQGTLQKPVVRVLPLAMTTVFTSSHPFSVNDGSLIAAKGLQTRLSGGLQMKAGFLEAQLAPELVWAANANYAATSSFGYNSGKSFQRIYPGQSTLQLTAAGFRAGVSTANQWWGPGVRNSLLMTYQAPGFAHFFVGSKRPQNIGIGHLEWQVTGGWLRTDGNRSMENRHLKVADLEFGERKRFLSGLTVSYQPKWIPGLYLGLNRVIQTFANDSAVKAQGNFERFFPVLALAAQKKNVANEDLLDRDQVASFFLRWIFPKNHFEFYLEYGYNDYKLNTRDYLLGTSHSAAHIAGVKKLIRQSGENRWIDLNFEITKMSQTPDYMVRNAGNWYEHGSIKEGYTHDNQIMGSIYGFGADAVYASMTLVRDQKRLGFFIEQIKRDPVNRTYQWTDLGIGFAPQWTKDRWLFNGKAEIIHSSGYGWEPGKNRINVLVGVSWGYRL
ncbi:capsule assembly Wzi family protein [Sediminibacterium sp. KACHI17]